jgi:hypothetical protein
MMLVRRSPAGEQTAMRWHPVEEPADVNEAESSADFALSMMPLLH